MTTLSIPTKSCSKCGEDKPLARFKRNRRYAHGHAGVCQDCINTASRERSLDDPNYRERRNAASRRYRAKNPEAIKLSARKTYERSRDQGWVQDWHFRARYGITLADYNAMSQQQGHVCKICGHPETRVRQGVALRLVVDHDSGTGKVRGLLCHKCNTALGLLDHEAVRLVAAIAYLEASHG